MELGNTFLQKERSAWVYTDNLWLDNIGEFLFNILEFLFLLILKPYDMQTLHNFRIISLSSLNAL